MSRYLTPSKICLLALTVLYTESVVPSSATIPILAFLASNILPSRSKTIGGNFVPLQYEIACPISVFEKATVGHVSGIPGRTIWDLLLKQLWSIDSFDGLHLFFDKLSSLLRKSPEEERVNGRGWPGSSSTHRVVLSETSPLGSFVRRSLLEFTRLQFHDGVTLWQRFVTYRSSTWSQWKKRNPVTGDNSFVKSLRGELLGSKDPVTKLVYGDVNARLYDGKDFSIEDAEKLLEFQIDQMQRKSCKQSFKESVVGDLPFRDWQSPTARGRGQIA